jgi:hypothetical protein
MSQNGSLKTLYDTRHRIDVLYGTLLQFGMLPIAKKLDIVGKTMPASSALASMLEGQNK